MSFEGRHEHVAEKKRGVGWRIYSSCPHSYRHRCAGDCPLQAHRCRDADLRLDPRRCSNTGARPSNSERHLHGRAPSSARIGGRDRSFTGGDRLPFRRANQRPAFHAASKPAAGGAAPVANGARAVHHRDGQGLVHRRPADERVLVGDNHFRLGRRSRGCDRSGHLHRGPTRGLSERLRDAISEDAADRGSRHNRRCRRSTSPLARRSAPRDDHRRHPDRGGPCVCRRSLAPGPRVDRGCGGVRADCWTSDRSSPRPAACLDPGLAHGRLDFWRCSSWCSRSKAT